jgi:hypothetical protein
MKFFGSAFQTATQIANAPNYDLSILLWLRTHFSDFYSALSNKTKMLLQAFNHQLTGHAEIQSIYKGV